MNYRGQATFDFYADNTPWAVRLKTRVSTIKTTAYGSYGKPELNIPVYIAELTPEEYDRAVETYSLTEEAGHGEPTNLMVHLYEELPRQLLENPVAILNYWRGE